MRISEILGCQLEIFRRTPREADLRPGERGQRYRTTAAGYHSSNHLATEFLPSDERAVASPDHDVGAELDEIAVLLAEFLGRTGAPGRPSSVSSP